MWKTTPPLALLAAALLSAPFSAPLTAQAQKPASSWYDHAVVYEIYPRSFQDTDGDGIGDLKGVTQRLDYLKKLGIDAIWLTPFYPSPNIDFGYDISNYTDVAPEYGTMADWDSLVREAKKRNIRVLVDFVVNHTSDQHPWFQESRSSLTNPKRDWYIWKDGKASPGQVPGQVPGQAPSQAPSEAPGQAQAEPPTHWQSIFGGYTWTLDPSTSQWYYHIFLPQQPDVNWLNPGLRKAMFDVARFWLDHGASGFRLDATPYLVEDQSYPDDLHPQDGPPIGLKPYNSDRPENHEILKQLRAILDGYHGDPVLLGESVTANITGLASVYGKHRDEIQLPMDFLYGDMKKLNAAAFKKQIDDAESLLSGQTPVFFLSSHDHPRQWSVFGDGTHNDQVAKLTAAATLLQRGTALMYYGEELGMATTPASEMAGVPIGPKRPRADDRDGERTPMQWTAEPKAGFTTGDPWLPVQPAAKTYNVAAEEASPDSILSWYTQLLTLRHTPLFQDGSYRPLNSGNPKVFAFGRESTDGKGAIVVLNMSVAPERITLSGFKDTPKFRDVLLASPAAKTPASPTLTIAPFGTLVCSY